MVWVRVTGCRKPTGRRTPGDTPHHPRTSKSPASGCLVNNERTRTPTGCRGCTSRRSTVVLTRAGSFLVMWRSQSPVAVPSPPRRRQSPEAAPVPGGGPSPEGRPQSREAVPVLPAARIIPEDDKNLICILLLMTLWDEKRYLWWRQLR